MHQTTDGDGHQHSSSIVTSSIISAPTTTTYQVLGTPETREEFQEALRREEARRVGADRIRREQIVRRYEEGLCALRERIVMLSS